MNITSRSVAGGCRHLNSAVRSDRRARSAHPEDTILSSQDLVETIAQVALEKKAQDLIALDVEELLSYCGHFVICTAKNSRQARAIAQHVVETMKNDHEVTCRSLEGMQTGKWVLVDFGDVLLHVFDSEMRGFYDLDGLWADAPRVPIPERQAVPEVATA